MVALGYAINRGIGLTITLCIIVINTLQTFIYLYLHKHKKEEIIDVKFYIHCGCLWTGLTIMIGFIDAYGAYDLFSFEITKILVNTFGIRGVMCGVCIIIYGHFSAHYRAARKPIPTYFAKYFIISFIFNFLGSLLGAILTETLNKSLFRIEGICQVIWIIFILIIDLHGYFLVRALILDLKTYESTTDTLPATPSLSSAPTLRLQQQQQQPPTSSSPTSSPTSSPSPRNRGLTTIHSTDHHHGEATTTDELLLRIRRFHILIYVFNGGYLIYLFFYLSTRSEPLFYPPNPNYFSIQSPTTYLPYTIFFEIGILTWWAWIPFNIDLQTLSLVQTKKSKTSHHRYPSSSHHHPRKITSAILLPEEERGGGGRGGNIKMNNHLEMIELKTPREGSSPRSPSSEEEQILLEITTTTPSSPTKSQTTTIIDFPSNGGGVGEEGESREVELDISTMSSISAIPLNDTVIEASKNSSSNNSRDSGGIINVGISEDGQLILPQK